MKSKMIRFGSYWLRVYKICGEIRIDGGLNKFEKNPQKQTTAMLFSSKSQIRLLKIFAESILKIVKTLEKENKKWNKLK